MVPPRVRRKLQTKEESSSSTSDGSDSTGDTIGTAKVTMEKVVPSIVVGLASCIIVCTILLHCSNLREKRLLGQWVTDQRRLAEDKDNEDNEQGYITSVSSSTSESEQFWIHTKSSHEILSDAPQNNMLPPLQPEENEPRDEFEVAENNEHPIIHTGNVLPDDDSSISHVSTLTDTLMDENYTVCTDEKEKLSSNDQVIEPASEVTELSEKHRVSDDMDFNNLVQSSIANNVNLIEESDGSVCSSLTNLTNESLHLLGEMFLAKKGTEEQSVTNKCTDGKLKASTGCPFDKSEECMQTDEERDTAATTNDMECSALPMCRLGPDCDSPSLSLSDLTRSKELNHCSSFDDVEKNTTTTIVPDNNRFWDRVVREISFVPISKGTRNSAAIGLDLVSAVCSSTHPTVNKLGMSSPFVGRIFAGDLIICINEINTAGMSGKDVLQLIEGKSASCVEQSRSGGEMVKLTVLSQETDDASLLSDGQQSLDFGLYATRMEM